MDILESNFRSRSESSKTGWYTTISIVSQRRLDEISLIENLPKNIIIEKLIMNYTPVPSPEIPGEFRVIYMREIPGLLKLKPYAIIVSVYQNKKLGVSRKLYREYRDSKISQVEFTRLYIERLMLPDAQREIKKLRKLQENHDVYITSFEREEEGSIRKIFVDFVNGKLVWK